MADYRGCPPPAVAPAPPQLELTQHIAFAWNSSELTPDSHTGLDEVVVALRDRTDLVVQVDGHASSDGGEVYNQELSEARAAAVVDYLVAHGIARDRLAAKGFSSSMPTESNATRDGRVANRRVEFVIAVAAAPKGNTP
ncbi:MAG: OmpA family protein [Deltaproteobacteria bacterium]|nr:OmpA family protein [Deltaproteobacteria bacterium]